MTIEDTEDLVDIDNEEAYEADFAETEEEPLPLVAKRAEGEQISTNFVSSVPIITKKELIKSIKYPSSILFVAKKFAGKSNALLNIINPKKFDNIFVVTVSGHTGNLNYLVKSKDNIFEEINDEIIELILDFQVQHPKAKTAIILDDFINSENTLRRVPLIMKLATSGRNFGVTLVICSQNLTSVPPALRKNAEYLFVGKNLWAAAKGLGDEYGTVDLPPKELRTEISNIKDHSFLFYDERKGSWFKIPETEMKVYVK